MSRKAPVVLIHGMWSTPESLKDLKAAFEEQGYLVHVPRLPFHLPKNQLRGELGKKLAAASIEDYVSCISECIEQLEQKPIVVGHSMGGLLAQLIAAKYDCEKLVLISSAPPAGINSFKWSVLRTFGHNLFLFPLWRKTTNLLLKNIQYGIANTQSADVQKEIVQTSTFESGKATWQISMWILYRKPPTRVHYENIKCPVLLISGTEDKITPIKLQRKLAQKYSDKAELKVIEGACHWTIGGSFFPEIKDTIFSWINKQVPLIELGLH
jgi:pimeloyl-ACP methyl ester carboxylesterase